MFYLYCISVDGTEYPLDDKLRNELMKFIDEAYATYLLENSGDKSGFGDSEG